MGAVKSAALAIAFVTCPNGDRVMIDISTPANPIVQGTVDHQGRFQHRSFVMTGKPGDWFKWHDEQRKRN